MWEHIKFGDLAFEEKDIAASLIEQITKEVLLTKLILNRTSLNSTTEYSLAQIPLNSVFKFMGFAYLKSNL
jgi:hypothetical protein